MDNLYRDRALVELYDAVNASRPDFDFYIERLPKPPAQILDIGCGTGTFAIRAAKLGYSVTGVDPAAKMIAAARGKDGSTTVNWIAGTASDVPTELLFDVAIMTGHAFQCLLHGGDIETLFRTVATRLVRNGSFWFETRNAQSQPWKNWTSEHSQPPIKLADGRTVRVVQNVLKVQSEFVSFEENYEISDQKEILTSRSILHFPSLQKIEYWVENTGLRIVEVRGDWEGGEYREDSPEIILRLEKSR